jgi:hypothetical protein
MQHQRRKTRDDWAMWWGVGIALLFITAATMSLTLDDRGTVRSTSFTYDAR